MHELIIKERFSKQNRLTSYIHHPLVDIFHAVCCATVKFFKNLINSDMHTNMIFNPSFFIIILGSMSFFDLFNDKTRE